MGNDTTHHSFKLPDRNILFLTKQQTKRSSSRGWTVGVCEAWGGAGGPGAVRALRSAGGPGKPDRIGTKSPAADF